MVKSFLNFIVILNERYVATWDLISYNPHRLVLPSGWRTTCAALWNEFIAIGARLGSSVYGQENGRIYFWDGVADTFNYSLEVPEGAINSMVTSKGIIEFIAGYQGDLMWYGGGNQVQKRKRLPKITRDKYVEIMPGAMTVYQSILHFGVAGSSDSSVVERGVYAYGSRTFGIDPFLTYDYPISTGNRTATNIKVGMTLPVDRKLLIGWQDNTSYGVDVVDPTGNYFANGTIEYLIKDDEQIYKDKNLQRVKATFLPLNSGESIDVKQKINRTSSWTGLSSPFSTSNEMEAKLEVLNGLHKERQIAVDLYSSGSTSPTLLAMSDMVEMNQSEQGF
jgi:hypothetical protein